MYSLNHKDIVAKCPVLPLITLAKKKKKKRNWGYGLEARNKDTFKSMETLEGLSLLWAK